MLAIEALSSKESGPESGPIQVQGVYTEYTGSFSGGTLNSGRAKKQAIKEGRITPAMQVDPYLRLGNK